MLRRGYGTQKSIVRKRHEKYKHAFFDWSSTVFCVFRGPDFGCTGFVGVPSGAINGCSLATASRLKALLRDHVILHGCLMLRVTSVS